LLVKLNSKCEEDVLSSSFLFLCSFRSRIPSKGRIFLQFEKKVAKLQFIFLKTVSGYVGPIYGSIFDISGELQWSNAKLLTVNIAFKIKYSLCIRRLRGMECFLG